MATPLAIQAAIDSAGTTKIANIQHSVHVDATYDEHYVVGVSPPYHGRAKWVRTTAANDAATQAAALLAGLT